MYSIDIFNNIYNDIHIAVDKLNNNKELSFYDCFLLDNISFFAFSFRSIRKSLENFNKQELKK